MDQRHERVLLETTSHRIAGTLTLARDGYRSRVSDLLNAPERDFISLTNCVVELVARTDADRTLTNECGDSLARLQGRGYRSAPRRYLRRH